MSTTTTLIAGAIFVVCCGLGALFIYASSVVSNNYFEGNDERSDHELAMSAQRARVRLANEERAALAAVLAVRPTEPRDPAIGVDQARAEVRARIHRYNRRHEVS